MTSNQPTLNFSLRQPGRPRVFTKEEIKERRKEQWRRYMKNKKTNQSKEPISTSVKHVGHPRIYTEEEAQQRKRERVQKYYRENRDKCLEQSRRWYLRHKAETSKQTMAAC